MFSHIYTGLCINLIFILKSNQYYILFYLRFLNSNTLYIINTIKSSKDFPANNPRYPPKAISMSVGPESRVSVTSTN